VTCQCRNGFGEWQIRDLQWSTNHCPKQQVSAWSWLMLQLFASYQDGHLPIAGGAADQPYKVMRAFQVIAERRAHNAEKQNGKKTPR